MMVSQMRAIDKARLIEYIGGLPEALKALVTAALKLHYDI
ncbi:MAG: hypothetical protein ACD_87C00132G0002 [uncultured bacterium]|nr:MAG: hypothetical protein ACD_87C00132G0002 [uncultured bacterium]